ncbi:MAG: DsrE family protein [Succinivibrionaceae bacterium]
MSIALVYTHSPSESSLLEFFIEFCKTLCNQGFSVVVFFYSDGVLCLDPQVNFGFQKFLNDISELNKNNVKLFACETIVANLKINLPSCMISLTLAEFSDILCKTNYFWKL